MTCCDASLSTCCIFNFIDVLRSDPSERDEEFYFDDYLVGLKNPQPEQLTSAVLLVHLPVCLKVSWLASVFRSPALPVFLSDCRPPGWDSGCGSGLECSSGSLQDPSADGRLSDLLEYCLW